MNFHIARFLKLGMQPKKRHVEPGKTKVLSTFSIQLIVPLLRDKELQIKPRCRRHTH